MPLLIACSCILPPVGGGREGAAEMMIKAEKAHAISGEVSCNYVLTDLLIYFTVCTGAVLQTKLKKICYTGKRQ